MAINPSTKYGGQVSTSDPTGYPYGRAQNEAVSGDGTGTPLEADWISDWFGFAQALLAYHGSAVPTGVPDKVGASQYLAALTGSDWAWTGHNTIAQELDFAAPKTYAKWIPAIEGVYYDTAGGGTAPKVVGYSAGNVRPMLSWPSNSLASDQMDYDLGLPSGATVLDVRLSILASDSTHTVFSSLYGWTQDHATGASGSPVSMRTAGGGSGVTTIGTDQIVTVDQVGSVVQLIDRSANLYKLSVAIRDVPGGSPAASLKGIWVQYSMPGYRNG